MKKKSNINDDIEENVVQIEELEKIKKKIKVLNFNYKKTDSNKEKKDIKSKLKSYKFMELKLKHNLAKNSNLQSVNEDIIVSKQMEQISFKSNIVKFSKLHSTQKKRIRYSMIIVLGIVASISALFLIQNSGLYSPGVSALLQGFARLIKEVSMKTIGADGANIVYNILFWSLYFIVNIPLLIFSYKKISKKFTLMTLSYIITSQIFGLLISNLVPNINQIFIFGNVQNVLWDNNNVMPLLVYGIVSGLISGLIFSLIYILGSCAGGSDIVSFYYAKIKNKSVALMLTYINLSCIFIGTILGTFIPEIINNKSPITINFILQQLFSPSLIFSMVSSIISSLILNSLFPKHRVIKINVYSDKVKEIREALLETGYGHSVTINNTIGGYLWTSKQNLETICMYMELPSIINKIRDIDSEALIATQRIVDLDGKIMVSV